MGDFLAVDVSACGARKCENDEAVTLGTKAAALSLISSREIYNHSSFPWSRRRRA